MQASRSAIKTFFALSSIGPNFIGMADSEFDIYQTG
jgi:hypothetical protein